MTTSTKIFGLALGALIALAPAAAMADKLEDIQNAGVIRFGVPSDAAPWGFKDENGNLAGINIDLAKLMAEDMGVEAELVEVTGAGRIPSLVSDQVDILIASAAVTPERALSVAFSQPYVAVQIGLYGPDGVEASEDIASFTGKTVSVARGGTPDVWLTDNAPDIELARFEDGPATFAALFAGQVDLVAADSALAGQVIEQNPDSGLALKYLIRQSPAHIAVRQGEVNLLQWINADLFYNRMSGKLQELQMKWFHEVADMPLM